jgi:hypothetical protein
MSSQDSGEQSGTRQHAREAGAADNGPQMHAGHQQGDRGPEKWSDIGGYLVRLRRLRKDNPPPFRARL